MRHPGFGVGGWRSRTWNWATRRPSREIEPAAIVDGWSMTQVLVMIVLPLAFPGTALRLLCSSCNDLTPAAHREHPDRPRPAAVLS